MRSFEIGLSGPGLVVAGPDGPPLSWGGPDFIYGRKARLRLLL